MNCKGEEKFCHRLAEEELVKVSETPLKRRYVWREPKEVEQINLQIPLPKSVPCSISN